MRKKLSGGFSYIEMLIALAVFGILVMATLPILGQAGRNLAFARDAYQAHLAAQRIMLAVRDAPGGEETAAQSNAAGLAYRVWIFGGTNHTLLRTFPMSAPATSVALERDGFPFSGGATIIVVAVFDENENIAGRAIGVRSP